MSVVANSLRLRSYDARPDATHAVARRGALARVREAWFLAAIALAAFGASALPFRRATAIDPIRAPRSE